MKKKVGINGFGRFSLHLLKFWLDRKEESNFEIKYINDDLLEIDKAIQIIKKDKKVIFNKYKIKKIGKIIRFIKSNGSISEIEYSNYEKDKINWIGQPEIFFECSGKNTLKKDCLEFLKGKTSLVIISATSWDPDKTIIFGFNNQDYKKKHKVISYGSCTVNAFVPLADYINKNYGVKDADVNVIHNIQEYRLAKNHTLNRKFCTLEKSGPRLLKFLNKNNFNVNYTVVPYTGVSSIDFRFRIRKRTKLNKFIKHLKNSIHSGKLEGLYNIHDNDRGPEVHNCSPFSAVFIEKNFKINNDQIYIFGYFDNENSANRYFDLANFISFKK